MAENRRITRDWLDGQRKQLEVARQVRSSNPQLSMSILNSALDELLKRLPESQKLISKATEV
jgi:hypothetical protein